MTYELHKPKHRFIRMQLATRLQQNRDQILALAKLHGAENVRVFGSVVKGTSTESSDLDLLVSLGPKRTPFFPGGLIADLEDLLGCKIDVVTEKALHPLIREGVLREARAI